MLSGAQLLNEGPRLKSIASKIYCSKWKMDVHLNTNVYTCMKQLINATYNTIDKDFKHPFGYANDILAYIDRVCWRINKIATHSSFCNINSLIILITSNYSL